MNLTLGQRRDGFIIKGMEPKVAGESSRVVIADFKSRLVRFISSPPLILFLVNILLIHPIFLPELHDLGMWDEAAFIQTGYRAFSGGLPPFAANPFMSLMYGALYLLFGRSPFWMVHLASAARVIMFSLLWWGTYLVASRLKRYAHPLVVMGIFFVLPFSLDFLTFPSDPVFAGLAAFSLWGLLGYYQEQKMRHLYLSSFFMGLAALARNDGLVLFVVLVALTVILSWRRPKFVRALIAVGLPFLVIVFGYVGLRGILTGDFALGTVERTYQNFESGHQVLIPADEGVGGTIEARLAAREVYGTPEENQYSVIRAIMRAPEIYLQRLKIVLLDIPIQLFTIYGKQFSSVLFLLAFWGLVELFKSSEFKLIAILLLWPTHLITSALITIFRLGHLMFSFYIVLILAGIGLSKIVADWSTKSMHRSWSFVLAALAAYGVIDNKLAITYNAILVLGALWIAYWLRLRSDHQFKNAGLAGWLVLLLAGIILRGDFPSFKVRVLGDDPREQALLALYEYLDEGDLVATRDPGMVVAARLTPLTLASTSVPLELEEDAFMDWLIDQGVEAVYADHMFASSPAIWEKIQPHIGTELERVFIADGGDIQILLVTSNQESP
jgi:hypothetical protein